jgi:ATP-binding protein involved in chromosome partitioning
MVAKMKRYPSSVEKGSEKTLSVTWSDGQKADLDVVELRRACVCAHCVDEHTREQILKAEDVAETVRPIRVRNLGRYALMIDWTDGHSSSIYSWDALSRMSGGEG